MRFYLVASLFVLGNLLGCDRGTASHGPGTQPAASATPSTPRTLTVFAAASLTESFREIGKQFESANPGVTVVFSFGGSQQLRAQLEQGAPADVFASANTKEMDAALNTSTVVKDTNRVFAQNRLVVIYPKDNPAKLATLANLANPNVKIDVADPAVPAGHYTMTMLDALAADSRFGAGFKKNFLANIVSREENVKAVVTKVRLGEVDAGIVYVTDAGGEAAKELGKLEIPARFNPIAEYPIAVTTKAKHPDLAKQFTDFVLSAERQKTLAKHGFVPGKP